MNNLPPLADSSSSAKARRHHWLTILALFLYAPLGVILLWARQRYSTKTRVWLTTGAFLWFAIFAFDRGNTDPSSEFWRLASRFVGAASVIIVWRLWGESFFGKYPEGPKRSIRIGVCGFFLYAAILLVSLSPTQNKQPANGQAPLVSQRSPRNDNRTGYIETASRKDSNRPQKTIRNDEALKVATECADRIEAILNQIRDIPASLAGDPSQLPMLIGVARRARVEADKLQSEVQDSIGPSFDRVGGDFASVGGNIGHSLLMAATEAKSAAVAVAMAVRPDGSVSNTAMRHFQQSAGAAGSALRDLRQGIEDQANPQQARERRAVEESEAKNGQQKMLARMKDIPPPKPDAKPQQYRIVQSAVEPSGGPGAELNGTLTITSPKARCFEEYALTASEAAEDYMKTNGLQKAQCILLPSAESDGLWTLAIARLSWNGDTGKIESEVLASKQVYSEQEIAIMEAWAKARKETPSQLTDDIIETMVGRYGLEKESINSIPIPNMVLVK